MSDLELALAHSFASPASVDSAAALRMRPRAERSQLRTALRALEGACGQQFTLLDVDTGEIFYAGAEGLRCDLHCRLGLLGEVARRGRAEIIEHESPLMMLAAPLRDLELGESLIAVDIFVDQSIGDASQMASAARVFGVDAGRAYAWALLQDVWNPRVLLRLAEATIENVVKRAQVSRLEHEVHEALGLARDTAVELGLLQRMTRLLDVSHEPDQLWRHVLAWLHDCLPAQGVAVIAAPGQSGAPKMLFGDAEPYALVRGDCPLESRQLPDMIERLEGASRRPLAVNRTHTSGPTWPYATVRELATAPIIQHGVPVGWLAAINHTGRDGEVCEFGSSELQLLGSAADVLSVHRSNTELFQQQGDLFAASVKTLTSAIDAKDAYTRGHSERVARIAVCLAEQLGLPKEELGTIYLGGLLHDIGKIGVDDQVLNKPGPLSVDEFEQIKKHPQLGYEILRGVRQLQKILPIVLHHHESWDGSGYPHGLHAEGIPLLPRVLAVADAFDAMSSDRPYRQGMPDTQVDRLLREGAGRQWDPQVVDSFFACRDTIRKAVSDESIGAIPIDPLQWLC